VHTGYYASSCVVGLFTRVRRIGILRTSPLRSSPKFTGSAPIIRQFSDAPDPARWHLLGRKRCPGWARQKMQSELPIRRWAGARSSRGGGAGPSRGAKSLSLAGDEQRRSRVRPPVQLALGRAWSEQERMTRRRSAGFTKVTAARARNKAIIANRTGALQHHVGR
jgi:hypothetical protein